MTKIAFRAFGGEIPHLPSYKLPEGSAQQAINCDLQHGEVRGLRGNAFFALTTLSAALRSIYTVDGINFFGWPYEVYAVKSMVPNEIYYRVYYSAMDPVYGPVIKVARTARNTNGTIQQVIGNVVPNFNPPETSNADSWTLGVPAPLSQWQYPPGQAILAAPSAVLYDLPAWPNIPGLQLTVTYFIEDQQGNVVQSFDISNTENINGAVVPNYPQIITSAGARGTKIQDMWWALQGTTAVGGGLNPATPRPYKFYFFQPPVVNLADISRVVTETAPASGTTTAQVISSSPASGPPTGGA